jgi:outer membrane scaffolding protein for murein synthesis (MipA/OmpV family)
MRRALLAPVLCAALAATQAAAGTVETPGRRDQLTENLDDAPGFEPEAEPPEEGDWAISVGAIGSIRPEFPGADSYELGVAPNFSVVWRDRLFLKNETAGVNLIKTKTFRAGLDVRRGHGRGDEDELEGLDEVDDGVEVGGFLRYDPGPLRFSLSVRRDVASGHEGTLVVLGASTKTSLPGVAWVRVKGEATLASAGYMRAFFGVDAAGSAASGLAAHKPDAGFRDLGVSLTTGYRFFEHWTLGGVLTYRRLVGGAADSPIVEDRGSPNQLHAGLGLSYSF